MAARKKTEADTVRSMSMIANGKEMFGREVIKLDYDVIDESNILDALSKVLPIHDKNAAETEYLWQYYKGNQPILHRTKTVRPEINNKTVVNVANEIVSFKVGYEVGEPIQYVSRINDEATMKSVMRLNEFMFSEDKAAQDQEIAEWQAICGTCYRLVLPDQDAAEDEDESPFELYTMDPRDTFVAYSTRLGNNPILSGTRYQINGKTEWTLYTDTHTYVVRDGKLISADPHAYWMIPIFEYPFNRARLGAFEIVLPLTDFLNNVQSNRGDNIDQIVQAFIKFINCDIDEAKFAALERWHIHFRYG